MITGVHVQRAFHKAAALILLQTARCSLPALFGWLSSSGTLSRYTFSKPAAPVKSEQTVSAHSRRTVSVQSAHGDVAVAGPPGNPPAQREETLADHPPPCGWGHFLRGPPK
eukprot:38472-Prorocentrum_minimum.AAC.1